MTHPSVPKTCSYVTSETHEFLALCWTVEKKVVTADQQRAAAGYLGERYGASQRRICGVMGRSRSTLRYHRTRPADEPALTKEMKRLARRHPRFGHRRIHVMLVRRGWTVNLKRVRRL